MVDTGCQVTILVTSVVERMCVADPRFQRRLHACGRRLVSADLSPLVVRGEMCMSAHAFNSRIAVLQSGIKQAAECPPAPLQDTADCSPADVAPVTYPDLADPSPATPWNSADPSPARGFNRQCLTGSTHRPSDLIASATLLSAHGG